MVGELDGTRAAFGRRRFVQGAIGAATAGGVAGSLAWPHTGAAHPGRDRAPLPEPKPTVEIDDDAFEIGRRHATLRVQDAPVIDSFVILGPSQIPASVSFEVRWEATGPRMRLGSGTEVPPTDPAAFAGRFSPARATGWFSGRELGFSFRSDPGASSDRGYAELGRERNGAFLS